jgi:lipopolysaccharide transport system permease protein
MASGILAAMTPSSDSGLAAQLFRRRELVRMLAVRNLKIRYKNSALGFLWSLLTPGCFILIYAVFAGIIGMRGELLGVDGSTKIQFLPFLVTGIVVWQFTATCFNDGLHAVTGNANLVKKAAFPRLILPVSMTLANTVNFLLTLAVLALYLFFEPSVSFQGVSLLWLPAAVAAQFALGLGLALLVSTANVFFRDTEHIVGVASLAWFFLTPIFYPTQMQLDLVAEKWNGPPWLVYLNPMTGIVEAYRQALLGGGCSCTGILLSFGLSLVLLAAGLFVFQRAEGSFGDVL